VGSDESPVSSPNTDGIRQTWIFQANPERYRILESLSAQHVELWNLRQHAHDVHAGDRVLIWLSGQDAGIYAIGTVLSRWPELKCTFRGRVPQGPQAWVWALAGHQ
jgi:hypothetical protein